MRRLLPMTPVLLALLLSGCGGGTTAPTSPAQTTTGPGATAGPQATGSGVISTSGPAATTGPAAVIPAKCASGFTDYLKLIEPLTASFEPATAVFGDFFDLDNAVSDKGNEAMDANAGKATYSCSEVGLEFNSFDASSPWAAILEIARAKAPGTVAYLQVSEKVAALDAKKLGDFGVSTCDDAVTRIRKAVADQSSAGMGTVADMGVDAGLALLGLYDAYISEVQDGNCPPDVLGNVEFDFMGVQ